MERRRGERERGREGEREREERGREAQSVSFFLDDGLEC